MCRLFHLEDLRCAEWHGSDGKLHQITVCIVQPTRNPTAIDPHFGICRLSSASVRTFFMVAHIRIRIFAM